MAFGGALAMDGVGCCDGGGPPTAVACPTCVADWPATLYLGTPYGTITLTKVTGVTQWGGCIMADYEGTILPLRASVYCPDLTTPGLTLLFRWPSNGTPIGNTTCDGTPLTCANFSGTGSPCPTDSFGGQGGGFALNTSTCARPVNLTGTTTLASSYTDHALFADGTVVTLTE